MRTDVASIQRRDSFQDLCGLLGILVRLFAAGGQPGGYCCRDFLRKADGHARVELDAARQRHDCIGGFAPAHQQHAQVIPHLRVFGLKRDGGLILADGVISAVGLFVSSRQQHARLGQFRIGSRDRFQFTDGRCCIALFQRGLPGFEARLWVVGLGARGQRDEEKKESKPVMAHVHSSLLLSSNRTTCVSSGRPLRETLSGS